MKITNPEGISNNSFQGLFGKQTTITHNMSPNTREKIVRRNYHAFKDDSRATVKKETEAKEFTGRRGNTSWRFVVYKDQRLSFTKADFKSYKTFYGKELPKKFQAIEKELASLGLEKYINGGLIYSIKKWGFNILEKLKSARV